MKIGILTYHDTTNYGAILQEYALSKVLSENGYDNEVINYKCDAVEAREKLFQIKNISLKGIIKLILIGRANRLKHKEFEKFSKNNIPVSQEVYTKDNIADTNRIYDKFIVGSDQVWNTELSGNDMTFFLDFCNETDKKNSYAASFGVSKLKSNEIKIKKLLNEFRNITVRENEGAIIIKELVNKEVPIVLDPTFLIDKRKWEKLSYNNKYNVKNEYILLYLIQDKRNTIKYAKNMAKSMKCDIVYVNISPFREKGMKNIRFASPNEFLFLLKNAKLIITGSYHGIALSINMNKDFIFETNSKIGNYNSRINTIIKLFKLEDRKLDYNILEYKKIDYMEVNSIIKSERKKSLDLLRGIIDE